MLEDLAHTVHEASSGREGLSIIARESAIELVLTDQGMPQMTGAEFIAELKSRRPTLPVILASGFAELPAGIDPIRQVVLAKPLLQHHLQQALAAVLENPETLRKVRFRSGDR
jgi:CheY-like chemotaxis protein